MKKNIYFRTEEIVQDAKVWRECEMKAIKIKNNKKIYIFIERDWKEVFISSSVFFLLFLKTFFRNSNFVFLFFQMHQKVA